MTFLFSLLLATLALAGVALLVPSLVLLVECLAACLPARADRLGGVEASVRRGRLAVLIPAHNESSTLPATLAATLPQLSPGDRVLVVADNCTDDTARRARDAGAEVFERSDEARRGKGYALAAGVSQLAAHPQGPPDVIVFLDADVPPPPGAIPTLAQRAMQTNRPVQAVYLLTAPATPTARDVVSELAFLVKNHVRPLGLHKLGRPVHLTGTGIAVPWEAISRVHLASGDLVEDMKLGLDLLRAGFPPRLCPDVRLVGELPIDRASAYTQRTRWEQGHLSIIRRYAWPLLRDGLRPGGPAATPSADLLALGLDLLVPPLALLTAMIGAVALATVVVAAAWVPTASVPYPVSMAWAAAAMLPIALAASAVATAVAVAYVGFARHLPLRSLLAVPVYVAWKLPLYARALLGRAETRWVRTSRQPNPPGAEPPTTERS